MTVTAAIINAFAPTGILHASINLGNPLLAHGNESAEPGGLSVDLARELAKRLGLPLELVSFDAAGKSVEAVAAEVADVGFFAVDPVRGADIAFTAPYLLIEGWYLVREDSSISVNSEVDEPGVSVAVGKGSAYDLYLTRQLKRAEIVRSETSPGVVDLFLDQELDVAAGVRQQLEMDAARVGGLRLLDERFMVIRQAMGLPKSRGEAAHRWLAAFVEEVKASGFIADAMTRHNITGVNIAPPENL